MQAPCEIVGFEESEASELHCQILLFAIVVALLVVQENLLVMVFLAWRGRNCGHCRVGSKEVEMGFGTDRPEFVQSRQDFTEVETVDHFLDLRD